MQKLLVGIVLVGVLVGCSEPDYALIANQLEEQLEVVLAGGTENFDHIEIEEGSDAAVIRGNISSLSLGNTLGDIAERQLRKDLHIDYIIVNNDASLRERHGHPAAPDFPFGTTEEEWIEEQLALEQENDEQESIDNIRAKIDALRDQAKES